MPEKKNFQVTLLCSQPLSRAHGKDDFCKACRKHIPDLRNASTKEILRRLERDGGKSCGKFYADRFEINEETRRGPGLFRLVATGFLATLLAGPKLYGQTAANRSVKTEQLPVSQADPLHPTPIPTISDDTTAAIENDTAATAETKPSFWHRRWMIKENGRRKIYLSWRFPFLHIRRNCVLYRGAFTILID